MKKFQSLESVFMGVMGLALFLFVGLSFAFIAPRHIQAARTAGGDVACAPAAVANTGTAQPAGGDQATGAAQAQRNAS
jgi:hypothetical protein